MYATGEGVAKASVISYATTAVDHRDTTTMVVVHVCTRYEERIV